jgi:proline dehydrogenase
MCVKTCDLDCTVHKRLEISVELFEKLTFYKKQGNGIGLQIYIMRLL